MSPYIFLLVMATSLSGVSMVRICPVDEVNVPVLRFRGWNQDPLPFPSWPLARGKETRACLFMETLLVIMIAPTKGMFCTDGCLGSSGAGMLTVFVYFPDQISILRCKAIFICIMISTLIFYFRNRNNTVITF